MQSNCASLVTGVEKKEQKMEELPSVLGSGRKNVGMKETAHSILNSVNKIASQIKKPPHRRRSSSPIIWFPRKKIDSYLKRKIKLLQEGDGMSMSLVETLGNANPHYTKIAREKIAAREAASKAMEAHKAAMVEASLCRILQAARIQSKDAQLKLEKAELCAAEAFEEAKLMGVMMFDRPDCPRRPSEVQSSASATGEKSAHTITASFETAFEVDREVAAAVREAFIKLANCSSFSNKKEFRDLLRKIMQNPDDYEVVQETSTAPLQYEFDHGSGLQYEFDHGSGLQYEFDHGSGLQPELHEENSKIISVCHEENSSNFSEDFVNSMVDRLKELQDDELASLATIVATCGLNAALLKLQGSQDHQNEHDRQGGSRRSDINESIYACKKRKEDITNVPSLDKFLVKHESRLEREVHEARISKKNDVSREFDMQVSQDGPVQLKQLPSTSQSTMDLGSILIKHVSKFEREIQEAKNSCKEKPECNVGVVEEPVCNAEECEQLTKPISSSEELKQPDIELHELFSSTPDNVEEDKENKKMALELREITNRISTRPDYSKCLSRAETNDFDQAGLDKILVKPVHWLEREKLKAKEVGNAPSVKRRDRQLENIEPLHEILVKHQSKLEREKAKLAAAQGGSNFVMHKGHQHVEMVESLDEILVKHQSKFERHKLEATQSSENPIKHMNTHMQARERELREAWGGLSLGNSLQPHLSKLEKDKAAWKRAEEEQIRARDCSK